MSLTINKNEEISAHTENGKYVGECGRCGDGRGVLLNPSSPLTPKLETLWKQQSCVWLSRDLTFTDPELLAECQRNCMVRYEQELRLWKQSKATTMKD
jgi:hypothetical protein